MNASGTLLPARAAGPLSLAVPSLGNLDAYISGVNRIPLLTAEQETDLARRLRDHNDLEAARGLVLSHLRLVVSVSRQYLGYGLPQADLIQEGNIGLMKAVKRFDPERGVRLVSFALHWIKAEMHEYVLRNWRLVKVATTKAQRKLFFNLRSMKPDQHALSPEAIGEIARELNVKEADVAEMEVRMGGHEATLDPQVDDGEEGFAPIAYLAAPDADPADRLASRERDRLHGDGIEQALATLDPRSRKIVETRWLRDDTDGGTRTLQDLADEYGVSAERIRQIEVKALAKMKTALASFA
ncbi:MAG: RNA polymerase sigma factor RpoH [Lautropia sp.]